MATKSVRRLGPPGQVNGTPWRTLRTLGAANGLLLAVEHIETKRRRTLWLLPRQRPRSIGAAAPLPPHVCLAEVRGLGHTASGVPFVLMEALEGELLSERLRRDGAVRVPRAVELAACLFEALAALHGAGLSHGEVSTSALVVLRAGGAKLFCATPQPGSHRARRDDVARAAALLFEAVTGRLPLCDAPTWNGSTAPPSWRASARLDHALPDVAPELAALLSELLGDGPPPAHIAAARLRRLLIRGKVPSLHDAPTVAVRYDAPTLIMEPMDAPTLVDPPGAIDGFEENDESEEALTLELPGPVIEPPFGTLRERTQPLRKLLVVTAVASFALAASVALVVAFVLPATPVLPVATPARVAASKPALRQPQAKQAARPPAGVAAPKTAEAALAPATAAEPASRAARAVPSRRAARVERSLPVVRKADDTCVTSLRSELPGAGL